MTADPNIWEMVVDVRSQGVSVDEVRRALALIVDPDSSHEVRGLPSGRSRTIHGNALDAAVKAVEELADDKGVYVTLNPVRPDLDRAARVSDILSRRRLLIDCDRRANKDQNATEAEKDAARRVADAVQADLNKRGWPRPVVIDSGNGWHLLYAIDLPADKLSSVLLSKCLKTLQTAHGTAEAEVDVKVANASRITKLPGTWVRKGPQAEGRPHRMARLVSVPTAFVVVTEDQLLELAGQVVAPPPGVVAEVFSWEMTVPDPSAGGIDAYVRKAVEAECGKVAGAPEGDRNNALNAAAFNLGQLIHLNIFTRGEIERSLEFAARQAGLGEQETGQTINSGLNAGNEQPRQVKPKGKSETAAKSESKGLEAMPRGERLTIRASEVKCKAVDWLWNGRVAIGFLALFAGRTGLGKSFVTCDFAARITQGEDLPDGPSGVKGTPHNVLFISEDPYEYVLAPRLLELGADMNRVSFLTWEAMAHYTLADTAFLERAWVEAEEPILVCIDPPTNFLGGSDEHKNAEVRAVLMRLVAWFATKNTACILITHVNKNSGKGVEALSRIIGSVAWATTARVVHIFASDPDDPSRCLLLPDKNNIGNKAEAMAYRIKKTDALAVVDWEGVVDTTADQAMAGEKTKPRRVIASQWIIERFREKREWPSDELFAAGKHEGLSRDAIFEAKNALNLPKARKVTQANGDHCWVWWVPPNWEYLNEG